MTRLQADIIKKDKRDKRKKGSSGKKSRARKNKKPASTNQQKETVRKQRRTNFERQTIAHRQRRSTAFYGIPTDTGDVKADSDQIRKIVQQIMDEMLSRVEQAAQVLNKAEEMNLDLETAKQSRRNSTDSNCSLKVKDQGQAETIVDLMHVMTEEESTDADPSELTAAGGAPSSSDPMASGAVVKKRRSSFAASFYSSRPTTERSLRRSNGQISYFQNEEKVDEEDESSPIRRRKKQKLMKNNDEMDDNEEEVSRPRRQITNNNSLLMDSSLSSSSRVVFPLEVKACAIQRIRDGETQVQVARDLQCPVSTVASWWHRRASILATEAQSDTTISSVSCFDFQC